MKNWSDDKWDRVMRLPENEQAKYLEEGFEKLSQRQQRDLVFLPDEGFVPSRKKRKKAYAKHLRKKGKPR